MEAVHVAASHWPQHVPSSSQHIVALALSLRHACHVVPSAEPVWLSGDGDGRGRGSPPERGACSLRHNRRSDT